ncbi:MAG TPA: hypothetical protein VN822_03560 [Candidatus Acidoferrales bacterium]|nr:hypothetical protein [Candidatus Acidoferrales bacterium]
MWRRLYLVAGLVLLASASARGQGFGDKVEAFGGYSYMHADQSTPSNLNGWELAGEYKFADWLGGVADFDGHYGGGASVHTYLFGPQVSWPARVSPFAHVLIGGAHVSSGGFSDSSFATAIGGGIDTELVHGIYWRIIQGDYLPTHFGGARQDNVRVSTGIAFHF